jgi:hypothetical protein
MGEHEATAVEESRAEWRERRRCGSGTVTVARVAAASRRYDPGGQSAARGQGRVGRERHGHGG